MKLDINGKVLRHNARIEEAGRDNMYPSLPTSPGRGGHGGDRHSVMAIQQLESIARDDIATLRRSLRGTRGQIIN